MSQGIWGLDFQRSEGFHGVGNRPNNWRFGKVGMEKPLKIKIFQESQLLAKQDSEHIYNSSLRYIFINGINQGTWVSR